MKQLMNAYRPLWIAGMIFVASCIVTVIVMAKVVEQSIARERAEHLVQLGDELTRVIHRLRLATNACRDFLEVEQAADVGYTHMITQTGAFCQLGLPVKDGWIVVGRKRSDGSHIQLYNSRKGQDLTSVQVPAHLDSIISINKLIDTSLQSERGVFSELFKGPVTGEPVLTTLAALSDGEGLYVSLAFNPEDILKSYLSKLDEHFNGFALQAPSGDWVFSRGWSSELKDGVLNRAEHEGAVYGNKILHHASSSNEREVAIVVHLENEWSLAGVLHKLSWTQLIMRNWQATGGLIVLQLLIYVCFTAWFVFKVRERVIQDLDQEARLIRHSDAQKASIIKSMAHEIRSPIVRLIGALEVARDSALKDSGSEIENNDQFLAPLTSASIVLQLCDDLLDLGQLGAGDYRVVRSAFDVGSMLEEIKNEYLQYASEQRAQIITSIECADPIILGDRLRIRQIITNLLHNALRASPGGLVSIVISQKELGSDRKPQLEIVVSDNGIGMSRDVKATVFDEFVTYSAQGTGLGLSIVKRIIQRLDGKIELESALGVGSAFKVTLPIVARQTKLAPTPRQAMLHNVNILLVEDEAIIRKATVRKLLDAGARVSTASDGREAVIMCMSRKFDVILMDLEMPNLPGLEASREIRSAGLNKDTFIFGLSSHLRKHRWESAVEAGMNELFTKPIEVSVISSFLGEVSEISEGKSSSQDISVDAAVLNIRVFGETCCLSDNGCNMDLLNGFITQALSFKKKLDTSDADDLSRLVHGFKGIAMIFGASLLTEKLFAFEEAIASESTNDLQLLRLRETISICIDDTLDAMCCAAQVVA